MHDPLPPNQHNTMTFRRSIWEVTDDYRFHGITNEKLDHIARVYNLMAAKLNIAFPVPVVCTILIEAIAALPDDPARLPAGTLRPALEAYLRLAKRQPGFDIKTAMCLLAVEKGGNYAPADRKVTKGLLLRQVVTEDEAGTLGRKDVEKFVSVYLDKVLPAWWRERQTRTARDVDDDWGKSS
ncbi:hypothetical protein [Janthinobacterium sp. SUN137]|uniref:hypothetical protein n=1 Tax=Janthinobacterium sp. SUN137 TaxID=3014789 RepID=UPI002712E778|nr:hypothetical protein [Janthinobacterium sp. SUN137]MDO8040322.1 hypothetical protein [Janthinobacterium sp. SUN137]